MRVENIELDEKEPLIVKLYNSKALSMFQAPIPIDPTTENVSVGDIEVDINGQVPAGVNITLVANENRILLAYADSMTIHCNFIHPWSLNITIGAHVATDGGAIQQFNFTSRTFLARDNFDLVQITEITKYRSIVFIDNRLSTEVYLRSVLWDLGGVYPIIIQFFIYIEGDIVELGGHVSNSIETEYYKIDAP